MHCSELCVFDNTHIEYVKDVPRLTHGGANLGNLSPPIKSDKKTIQKALEDIERIKEHIEDYNIKLDMTKYIKHTVPYNPSMSVPNIIIASATDQTIPKNKKGSHSKIIRTYRHDVRLLPRTILHTCKATK